MLVTLFDPHLTVYFPLGGGEQGRGARCEVCSWFRQCTTRHEVPGSIPGIVFGKFQATYFFCPHSVALGSTHPLTKMSTKVFPSG